MIIDKNESYFTKIRNHCCKKKRDVKKEDVGIYHYTWCCDTVDADSHGLRYDVYLKVSVINVYDELVEISVLDTKINDSASSDIINIIKNNLPTYLNPKNIKWCQN